MAAYQYSREPSAADYNYHGEHYQSAPGLAGGSGGLPVSITRTLRNQGGLSINVGDANKGDQAHAVQALTDHEQYDGQQYEHVDRGFDGDEEASFHEGSDEEVAEALQGGQHRFHYQQHHGDEMQGLEHDVDDEEVEGAEEDIIAGEFSDSLSSSPSIPDEDIDFGLVYALHTFLATVDGQASVVKGDKLLLLDDSNSYWWLVRVLKTQAIGYIPAENIETPWERLARLNKHRNVDLTSATQQDVITGPTSSSARTRFISRIPPSQQPHPHESRHPSAKGIPASPSHKDHPRNISPPPSVGRPGSSKAKTVGFAAPTYYAHSATGMTDEEGDEDGEEHEEGMDVEGEEGDELDRHPAEGFEENEEEDGLRAGAREESEFSDDHEHHHGAAIVRQEPEGVFADGEAEGEETDGEADDEDDPAEARRGRSPYDDAPRPSSSASAQGTHEAAKRQHWERESAGALRAQEQAVQAEAQWKRERDAQDQQQQQQRTVSPRVDSIGAAQGRRPLSPADTNLQHSQRPPSQDGLSPRTRQTDDFGLSPTQPGTSSLASSTRSSRFDEGDFLDSEAPTKKLTATPPIARDEDPSRFDDNAGCSPPPTHPPQLQPGGQPLRQAAQQPLRVRGVDLVDPRDPRYNRMLQPTKQAGEDVIYERVVADAQRQQRMQAQVDGQGRSGSLDYGAGIEGDASFGSVDTHTSSISEGVGASGSKKSQQVPTTTEKKRKSGGGILGLFRKKDKKKKGDAKDETAVRSSADSGALSPTSTAFRRSGSISPIAVQQAPSERTSSRYAAPTAESMFSTDAALRQQELEAKQALYHQYGVSRAPGDITNTMTPRGQPGGLSVGDTSSQVRRSLDGTGSKRNSLQLISHPASVVGPNGSVGSPNSLGPAGQRMRPGSLIGSPSIPGLEVPLLSVMRVFAGASIDSDATFKTVLLNQSTTAADLVKQAMQRFRLIGAELTRDDFYLTVKELGGDERPLHNIEKPLEVFEELSERAGEDLALPPNVRRSSVGSINSISSNLSLNPAIARSGVNDWSDDSAVKFYLHRRGHADSPLVGQGPLDGAEDSFAQQSSEHNTASDHTATPQLGPQSTPSYRFAVRLLIYPGDLPDNVVFDPASNAIIPKAVFADRQQRNGGFSDSLSPDSLSSSQQPREKVLFFPRNANVSEVIETALDRFGIIDGVVDGGDEVEDRVSRRRSVTRVKYSLAVLHNGKESLLNASSRLLDAYTALPLFKAYDRSSKEFRRRSADTSLILGSSADVQSTDPVFVIRRSPLRSTAGRSGVLPRTIDELEELQQRRQAEDEEQEVLRGSPNPATGPRSHRDMIAAQRAASRANQQAILSAQKNGEQGYDIAIRDQGTIRSARDGEDDEVRYSYVDESGIETDISRIVETEWQSKGRPGPPPKPVDVQRPLSSFSRSTSAATTTDADSFRTAPGSLPDGGTATDNESLADDEQQAIAALRSTNVNIDSPVSAFAPEVSPSIASFKTATAIPPQTAHDDVLKDALGPRPTTSPALDENLQERLERVLARVKEEKARRAASPNGVNVRPRSFMSSSATATPTGRFSPVNVGVRSASAMGGRRSPFGDGMRDAPSINQLMSQSTPPASALPREAESGHAKKDSIASVSSTASTTTDQLSTPVTGISSGFTPASSANSNHRPQIAYRDDFGYDTLLAIIEADSHAPARQLEQVSPEDSVVHNLFGRGLDSVPDLHPEVRSAYEGPAKALDDLDVRLDSLLASLVQA
ncbi:SH3 domain protein [Rhodotorula toruloides]|uniref:SH3 domain protein n=1 Tax=Rhodotorula toruloides TaxID=5286 RepID=A0A511K9F0_RHOTO|nr:SH3 domain protein [Rhodotorula toruloides]